MMNKTHSIGVTYSIWWKKSDKTCLNGKNYKIWDFSQIQTKPNLSHKMGANRESKSSGVPTIYFLSPTTALEQAAYPNHLAMVKKTHSIA